MCAQRQDCKCFFFNDTATTDIYTLSLHDALPIHEHRCPTSEPEWRHEVHAGHALVAPAVPQPLVRVVVGAARDQAPVARRVRGKRRVDREGRTRAGGEHERVALAPLVQAIELPHPEPDAEGRDQEGDHEADPIAPVYPHLGLILASFWAHRRPARARASRRVTAAAPRPRAAGRPTDPVGAPETPTVRGDARGCTRSRSLRYAASGALEGRW